MTFPDHTWRTSSYSANGGECVEVAVTNAAVGVRDSKHRAAGHFTVPADRWSAFLRTLRTGTYDL